jgi:single-strand DNA-binding protein
MYESFVTVVGNLTADPVLRTASKTGRPFTTFRVASTTRRRDPGTGAFVDGGTNFVNVVAFNALAANCVASLTKGQPVVVYGRLRVNQWAASDSRTMTSVEIDAYNVGHDLSWGQSLFSKAPRAQFDTVDRLAEDDIQDALAGLAEAREDGVATAAELGQGSSDDLLSQSDLPDTGQLVQPRGEPGASDPETDAYVVRRAG